MKGINLLTSSTLIYYSDERYTMEMKHTVSHVETEKFSPGRGKKNYTRDFLGQKTLQTRSFLFHPFPLF